MTKCTSLSVALSLWAALSLAQPAPPAKAAAKPQETPTAEPAEEATAEKAQAPTPKEARDQLRTLGVEQRQLVQDIAAREVQLAKDDEKVKEQLQSISDRIAALQQQIVAVRAIREDAFKAADPELATLYERRAAVREKLAELRIVSSRSGASDSVTQKRKQLQHQIRLKEMALRQKGEIQLQLKDLGTKLQGIQEQVRTLNTAGREGVFKEVAPDLATLYARRDDLLAALNPEAGADTVDAERRTASLQELRRVRGDIRDRERKLQNGSEDVRQKLASVTDQVTALHEKMRALTTTGRRELFAEADSALGDLYRQLAAIEGQGGARGAGSRPNRER